MSSDKRHGDGRAGQAPESADFAQEGLDDELLRQLERLLEVDAEGARGGPRRRHEPLRRRAREHLAIARLCFETNLSDRAETEAHAAMALDPDDDAPIRLLAAIHHRRGELGVAISFFGAAASRAPGDAGALAELGRLFEASMRDEPPSMARLRSSGAEPNTPPGVADLEHAFRLAFANNLQGALRLVDKVAARARLEARSLYKLAMLERAFLLEQAHDVRGAITTLERLADEPGLASDVERLLCLSMLYEREGTAERIRRALRAVRHAYLVTRRPTLLRRVARLLGKLGHLGLAEHFEARYLELFRRRMHALSLPEAARAASLAYVPLEALSRLSFPRRALVHLAERRVPRRRPEHRRRAAILLAWAGEHERAEAVFSELDEASRATGVDLLYWADIAEAKGEDDRARDLRRRGVAMLGHLDAVALAAVFGQKNAAADDARAALGTRERFGEAIVALRARQKAHPEDAKAALALSRIAAAEGRHEDALRHESHATAIEALNLAPRPFVLAAAALRRAGEVRGLVHEIWIDTRNVKRGRGGLDEEDVLGSVAPDLRARSVAIFYGVKAFVRARYPHRIARDIDDKRYLVRFTKDDEPSSGDSAGLPLAIAFASAMMGLSIPNDTAFTGAIVCDAHDVLSIARIGDVDAKLEGAYERRLSRLLLPAQNREDVEHAERVPRKIAEQMAITVRTLDEALAAVFPDLI